MKKLTSKLIYLLVILASILLAGNTLAAPTTVAITGTIYDNFGNPSVGTTVGIYPIAPTAQGSSLIMANPDETQTDTFGNFTLNPAGGVYAAFFVKGTQNTPTTLLKVTLPDSGTVTLSQLLAQPTNVVTSFPPNGNLNMNGFTFLNMAGASIAGEPVVEGAGLAGGTLYTSSGTFTIPTNATYIVATLLAAGGGGGGAVTNGGGGGGGGELLQCLMLPINGTITVTIGAPGTAGASTPANGGDASDTTVSQLSATTICDAGGGHGGVKGNGGGAGAGGAGGNAATEITGAALQMFATAGSAGSAGSGGAGGAGAGLSKFGGAGGDPGAAGIVGPSAAALLRAY